MEPKIEKDCFQKSSVAINMSHIKPFLTFPASVLKITCYPRQRVLKISSILTTKFYKIFHPPVRATTPSILLLFRFVNHSNISWTEGLQITNTVLWNFSISLALLLFRYKTPLFPNIQVFISPNMRNRKIFIQYSVFPFIISFSDRLWDKCKNDESTETIFIRRFRS